MKNKVIPVLLVVLFVLSLISAMYIVLNNRIVKTDGRLSLSRLFKKKSLKQNGVGIVYILGPIYHGSKSPLFSGGRSPDHIIKRLRRLRKRKDIKAIILRINSPGGSVASVQEIYQEIMAIRKEKKIVVASMGDVAASGGYYVAAAADKIVANPGTLTGSIGVIMEMGNFQELFKKIGVKLEVIKSGKYKDSGSPHRSLTQEERKIFQGVINDAYDQFVRAIMDGRNMDKKKVLSFANGRIFTGRQAFERGLVDKLGTKQDAIMFAAKLAGIEGEPRIVEESEPWAHFLTFIENIMPSFPLSYRELREQNRIRLDYILE